MFQVQNKLTFISSIWEKVFFLIYPGYKNALRLEIKGDMHFKDLNAEKNWLSFLLNHLHEFSFFSLS